MIKKKAASKKTAPQTKTIGINMNKKMAVDIEQRAKSMHLSASKYIKIILSQWIDSGQKLNLSEK